MAFQPVPWPILGRRIREWTPAHPIGHRVLEAGSCPFSGWGHGDGMISWDDTRLVAKQSLRGRVRSEG